MAVPASRFADALAGLLARAGARTVRVVDGRTGTVVGVAGDAASGSDDPAAVAVLLRDALPVGAGGADDVTLVTGHGVHVLRTGPVAGVFVHLQLDPGADPALARSALADPGFQDAVRRALGTARPAPLPTAVSLTFGPPRPVPAQPAPASSAAIPPSAAASVPAARPASDPVGGTPPAGSARPRPGGHPSPDPRRPAQRSVPQQPALAVLAADRVRTGAGARAVAALAELSRPDAPPVVLPRRRSGSGVWSVPAARGRGSTAGLPERVWAGDLETLRRLADGLRRLS